MVGEVHQDLEKLNKLLKKKRNFNSWRIKTAGKLVYFLHYFVLELLVANNFLSSEFRYAFICGFPISSRRLFGHVLVKLMTFPFLLPSLLFIMA